MARGAPWDNYTIPSDAILTERGFVSPTHRFVYYSHSFHRLDCDKRFMKPADECDCQKTIKEVLNG